MSSRQQPEILSDRFMHDPYSPHSSRRNVRSGSPLYPSRVIPGTSLFTSSSSSSASMMYPQKEGGYEASYSSTNDAVGLLPNSSMELSRMVETPPPPPSYRYRSHSEMPSVVPQEQQQQRAAAPAATENGNTRRTHTPLRSTEITPWSGWGGMSSPLPPVEAQSFAPTLSSNAQPFYGAAAGPSATSEIRFTAEQHRLNRSSSTASHISLPPPPPTIPQGIEHKPLWNSGLLFIEYPQPPFVPPDLAVQRNIQSPGKLLRIFLGQVPKYISESQLHWVTYATAGVVVCNPERILKHDLRTGERLPKGCLHVYCSEETFSTLVSVLNKRLLFDRIGFWLARTDSEMNFLNDYARQNKHPGLPHGTMVVEPGTSAYLPVDPVSLQPF